MIYGSVCSGIEAATVAWEPLGWKPAFFAEVEKFPCAVLAHHYPGVPNLGDMRKIDGCDWRGRLDVLVGGTPCQAFSVAGMRRGLLDDRGNLTLVFAQLANDARPPFIVWENVPGVLSDKTNAFGCLLGALAGEDGPLVPPGGKWTDAGFVLGPERAFAWRVLDAQYFGLAQRRRRVFLVACPRNGADPRAVLFEREGVRRDSAPSRETGKGFAGNAVGSLRANCGPNTHGCSGLTNQQAVESGHVIAFGGSRTSGPIDVATARSSPHGRLDFESETFCAHATQDPIVAEDRTHSVGANSYQAVAFHQNQRAEVTLNDTAGALNKGGGKPGQGYPAIMQAFQVRRLTPTECERLQGFPDDYTNIPWKIWKACHRSSASYEAELHKRGMRLRGCTVEDCPDGPRYKALGNSMAVPCMAWIGRRIAKCR